MGQRVGSIRVSSFDQNPERQLDGLDLDRVFTDHASRKDVQRPQLTALLAFVRAGDTVVIYRIDRLARNLDDLRHIVQGLTRRRLQIQFVKEQFTSTGADSPLATLLLSIMGAFAKFERALIRERQQEGIAVAKQRGAYKGRKQALNPIEIAQLKARAAAGESKTKLAREAGISRETLYQYLQRDASCIPPCRASLRCGAPRGSC